MYESQSAKYKSITDFKGVRVVFNCETQCTYDVVRETLTGRLSIHPLNYNCSGKHQATHYQDMQQLGGEL